MKPATSNGHASRQHPAVQTHLVPDARNGRRQVRIVGQQRFPGCRVRAGDHPGVGAHTVALPDQLGHRVERSGRGLQGGPLRSDVRRGCSRHTADRCGRSSGRRQVGVGQDRRVQPVVVRRVELGDPRFGDAAGELGPGRLLGVVLLEVPGHRLEPGQRVQRRPRLDLVVGHLAAEDDVLQAHLAVGAALEVGVDAVGVVLQIALGVRGEHRQLLGRHLSPAQGANDLVGAQRVGVRADQLGEPPGGHVSPEVHLEELVLGLHVALAAKQVVRGVGVDLRHALVVAQHGHRAAQPGQLRRATDLRERAPHEQHDVDQADHQSEHQHAGQPERDTAGQAQSGHAGRLSH